ncbi:MAG: hypothetical protein LAN84_09815 [Acidobacteriia bacterium]|nr:hypothetical protein [Terriglobia bacterium]
MRYGLHLLPDAFLLLALLRMTFVHLHTERRAMFFFLASWLVYSLLTLFLAQVHPAGSPEYAAVFAWLTIAAWTYGAPAIWLASSRVARSAGYSIATAAVLFLAILSVKFIFENAALGATGRILALNSWAAVLAGAIFLFASVGAQAPDRLLWLAAGIFFLVYGFGYIFIGMLRPGAWAYPALVLVLSAVWLALAWRVGANPEHLFNLEKLGWIPALLPRAQVLARANRG